MITVALSSAVSECPKYFHLGPKGEEHPDQAAPPRSCISAQRQRGAKQGKLWELYTKRSYQKFLAKLTKLNYLVSYIL